MALKTPACKGRQDGQKWATPSQADLMSPDLSVWQEAQDRRLQVSHETESPLPSLPPCTANCFHPPSQHLSSQGGKSTMALSEFPYFPSPVPSGTILSASAAPLSHRAGVCLSAQNNSRSSSNTEVASLGSLHLREPKEPLQFVQRAFQSCFPYEHSLHRVYQADASPPLLVQETLKLYTAEPELISQ